LNPNINQVVPLTACFLRRLGFWLSYHSQDSGGIPERLSLQFRKTKLGLGCVFPVRPTNQNFEVNIMKGLIAHYLEELLRKAGMLSEGVHEELAMVSEIEGRLDEVERGLKRLQVVPASAPKPPNNSIPFWAGSHRVPGAMDPLKVRLEVHPNEGGGAAVSPCWAILWKGCDEDEEMIMLAYPELEPLANLLMDVAASYRLSCPELFKGVDRQLDGELALGELVEETRRDALLEPTDDDFLDEREPVAGAEGWGNGYE
jgi:hypothetical protein